MHDSFEWMRIGIAMGLMAFAFVLLPMFFLWHDKRAQERATHRHLDIWSD